MTDDEKDGEDGKGGADDDCCQQQKITVTCMLSTCSDARACAQPGSPCLRADHAGYAFLAVVVVLVVCARVPVPPVSPVPVAAALLRFATCDVDRHWFA